MKHLDLFSGIGGFALAARRVGWETVGFVEQNSWCQKVLAKNFPGIAIYEDIHQFHKYDFDSYSDVITGADIVTGGFPCQPYSTAGQQRGAEDDRHLWPEMFRVISEIRPQWVVGENVAALTYMGLNDVISDMEGLGYITESFIVPACAVNAPHRRDRLWLVSYPYDKGESISAIHDETSRMQTMVADPECWEREMGRALGRNGGFSKSFPQNGDWPGQIEPTLDRKNDGLPNRLDRIRGLGNAIVPQVAEAIFRAINEIESNGVRYE